MNAEPNTSKQLEWPNYGAVNVGTPHPGPMKQNGLQVQQEREHSPQRSRLLWQALLLAIASQTACAPLSPTISPSIQIPPSLAAPCPRLPNPPDGTSAMLFLWVRDIISLYNDCSERHDRTVEVIK